MLFREQDKHPPQEGLIKPAAASLRDRLGVPHQQSEEDGVNWGQQGGKASRAQGWQNDRSRRQGWLEQLEAVLLGSGGTEAEVEARVVAADWNC